MNLCRIVLVRTEIAGNLGSTARIMRNLGASDLVLVAPLADPLAEQAKQMATYHAHEILQQARVVPDLESALCDCVAVAATSARTGGLYRRQTVGPPEEIASRLAEAMHSGRVALVFGPEPHGLDNQEVQRCHHLIHIPAEESYPALNLAQAVTICLYALRRAWQRAHGEPTGPVIASFAEQERMFACLEEGLQQIGYLRGPGGPALMHAVRHLLTRARLSPLEVGLLFGLGRQLEWIARRTRTQDEASPPDSGRTSAPED